MNTGLLCIIYLFILKYVEKLQAKDSYFTYISDACHHSGAILIIYVYYVQRVQEEVRELDAVKRRCIKLFS